MSFSIQILIAILILSAILYGVSCNLVREKSEAEPVIDEFYLAVQQRNWRNAAALYDPQFFTDSRIDSLQWAARQESMLEVLGDLQEYKLTGWTERKESEVGEPGHFFQLQYIVIYARDTAAETFILKKPQGQDKVLILSRTVNPARLYIEPSL